MPVPILAALAVLAGAAAPRRTPEILARGKAAYAIYCVACHGETGAGDGPVAPTLNPRPRNFSTEPFKQGSKVQQVFATLGKGVPGTAMVKFTNLSDGERWALSWYVLELRAVTATPARAAGSGVADSSGLQRSAALQTRKTSSR